MQLFKQKRGAASFGSIEKWIYIIIFAVILLKVLVALLPEGQAAGDELNASGLPLGSLFAGSGILWLIVMAFALVGLIKAFKGGK